MKSTYSVLDKIYYEIIFKLNKKQELLYFLGGFVQDYIWNSFIIYYYINISLGSIDGQQYPLSSSILLIRMFHILDYNNHSACNNKSY